MKKAIFALTTIALLFSIVVAVQASTAIPKPSIPEFTVKFVAHPYDVPTKTTTSIDQYTGKEIVTTQPGYHVENKSIEVTIRNQPFTTYVISPYNNTDGTSGPTYEVNLYYNVRVKGHFGRDWTELYPPYGTPAIGSIQSGYEYTVLSCPASYPDGAQVDFQVEAFIGYFTPVYRMIYQIGEDFNGQASGWSSTQTIFINASTPSLAASLSESASALNFGNTVNFTVSVDGGIPPYNYAWFMDGQSSVNSSSPYFSPNSQAVGSHHVYVQVTDADNNSATTANVEFNVLPATSTSPSLTPTQSNSPTQQPTPTPSTTSIILRDPPILTLYYVIVSAIILAIIVAIGALVYFKKYRIKK